MIEYNILGKDDRFYQNHPAIIAMVKRNHPAARYWLNVVRNYDIWCSKLRRLLELNGLRMKGNCSENLEEKRDLVVEELNGLARYMKPIPWKVFVDSGFCTEEEHSVHMDIEEGTLPNEKPPQLFPTSKCSYRGDTSPKYEAGEGAISPKPPSPLANISGDT